MSADPAAPDPADLVQQLQTLERENRSLLQDYLQQELDEKVFWKLCLHDNRPYQTMVQCH